MSDEEKSSIIIALERLEIAHRHTAETLAIVTKETAERLREKMDSVGIDIAVIKQTTTDLKNAVFGNGKEGLILRTSKLEGHVTNLQDCHGTSKTNDEALDHRLTSMETKIIRWSGIVIGAMIVINVVMALIINWDKIRTISH